MKLFRDPVNLYEPHLMPDVEISNEILKKKISKDKLLYINNLPPPDIFETRPIPSWYSVVLFFNLKESQRRANYTNTSIQDAKNWLNEGINPCNPTISEFMTNYWYTLSQKRLSFGIKTPRNLAFPITVINVVIKLYFD